MAARVIEQDEPTASADYTHHNYVKCLAELIAAGAFAGLQPGLFRLAVLHDEGCGLFDGGYCDCEPTFQVEEMDP